MGWADCGTDSEGRPIGYAHEATCDHDGCDAKIDRGLSHACGGMHGADDYSCERYFCPAHLEYAKTPDGKTQQLCPECRPHECTTCEGAGRWLERSEDGTDTSSVCEQCDGTGFAWEDDDA